MGLKTCLQSVLMFLLLLQTSVSDNGVENGISDICVDCIRRVQPSPETQCITKASDPTKKLCGEFKMSEAFYVDCINYLDSTPEEWNTWEKCYNKTECGQACVKAYHNHYTSSCAELKDDPKKPLVCADYGQIHFGGSGSCGPEFSATDFITNMTLLCGCQTVYGNRSKCLALSSATSEPQTEHVPAETFVGAMVGLGVASLIIIIIVILVAVYCSYKKNTQSLSCAEYHTPVDQQR